MGYLQSNRHNHFLKLHFIHQFLQYVIVLFSFIMYDYRTRRDGKNKKGLTHSKKCFSRGEQEVKELKQIQMHRGYLFLKRQIYRYIMAYRKAHKS